MLSDCQLFDLVENEWIPQEMFGRVPTPRAGHTCTVLPNTLNHRNQVLLMGGGNGQHYLPLAKDDIHVLDVDSMTWSQPHVGTRVKLYIKDDLIVNDDIINDASRHLSPQQSTKQESITDQDEEFSILIGTQTAEIHHIGFGTPSHNASLRIDSSPVVTTVKDVYPAPRSRHTAVVCSNSRVILFGGGGKNKIFDDLWILDVAKMEWYKPPHESKHPNRPSCRWGHTATVIGDKMYVFGGVFDSKMLNDLYELDTNTFEWRQITLPKYELSPAPRAAHTTTAVHGRYLFILWGGDDDKFLDDLYVYDLQKNIGKRLTFKTPKARCAHSALLFETNGVIYVFGGGNGNIRFKELYMLETEIAIKKCGFEVVSKSTLPSSSITPSPTLPPRVTSPPSSNNYVLVRTEVKVDNGVNNFVIPPPPPPPPINNIQNRPFKTRRRRNSSRRFDEPPFAKSLASGSDGYSLKDSKEVTNWLLGIGMSRYVTAFVNEEIDMDCLSSITDCDLFRMGITKIGPRRKILNSIKELFNDDVPSDAGSMCDHRDDALAHSINSLAITVEGLKESINVMHCNMQTMMHLQQQLQASSTNNNSPRSPVKTSLHPQHELPRQKFELNEIVSSPSSIQSCQQTSKPKPQKVKRKKSIAQKDEDVAPEKNSPESLINEYLGEVVKGSSWYEISKAEEEENRRLSSCGEDPHDA
ncbi:hypothetical protein AKO1_008313 [Acrasis kona]|uniref:SAM domain-containing protein n=1 Tax=Acrasis kona TaxID=1008807 RepID=A0AAW2YRB8_9EUKA